MSHRDKDEARLASKNLVGLANLIGANAETFDESTIESIARWVFKGPGPVITPEEVGWAIRNLEQALEVLQRISKPPYEKFANET